MLTLIGAMTQNRVIGKANQLPWRLPADLNYFKALTQGHKVVMGRKTYQSIGRSLPGRVNIILSHDLKFQSSDCLVVHSSQEILKMAIDEEIFVIGGASLYREFIPYAERLYLTVIATALDGDAYFPEVDSDWELLSSDCHAKDNLNPFDYCFLRYERSAKKRLICS